MMLSFKTKPPIPQNFIIVVVGDKETSVPIESLTKEEIQRYAEEMKKELIAHWERKQKPKRSSDDLTKALLA